MYKYPSLLNQIIRWQIWQIFDPSPPRTCRGLLMDGPKGYHVPLLIQKELESGRTLHWFIHVELSILFFAQCMPGLVEKRKFVWIFVDCLVSLPYTYIYRC